jgi:hypothetical protein
MRNLLSYSLSETHDIFRIIKLVNFFIILPFAFKYSYRTNKNSIETSLFHLEYSITINICVFSVIIYIQQRNIFDFLFHSSLTGLGAQSRVLEQENSKIKTIMLLIYYPYVVCFYLHISFKCKLCCVESNLIDTSTRCGIIIKGEKPGMNTGF